MTAKKRGKIHGGDVTLAYGRANTSGSGIVSQ